MLAPAPELIARRGTSTRCWPEEGYTKRDLIDFYRNAFPWMQPYQADCPLVLTRYPDGIA